jgi:hypothetical protein
MPPAPDLIRIHLHAGDVCQGNLETTAEAPHLVQPFDCEDSLIAFDCDIDHGTLLRGVIESIMREKQTIHPFTSSPTVSASTARQ